MATEVKDNLTGINEKENGNPRAVFYKKPIKKDNYNLDIDSIDSPQEVRRQRLLKFQKKYVRDLYAALVFHKKFVGMLTLMVIMPLVRCRDVAFNVGRGILEEAFKSEDEFEEDMEIEECDRKKYYSPKRYKHYTNQLMMSEWMLDVPQDLLEKWIIVPCPQGKRTLVVACKVCWEESSIEQEEEEEYFVLSQLSMLQGVTKAYNKRGLRLGRFYSALPGGNPSGHRSSCTIIDCVWLKQQKSYYVLDVLAWSNQSLVNCDVRFLTLTFQKIA